MQEIVNKALAEAAKQLSLGLNKKAPIEPTGAGPDTSEYLDLGLQGVLPRKKNAFRYSHGRLVNPTSWHGDNIMCNGCGFEYEPSSVPEVSMGAVACPKCGQRAVVDRGRSS